MNLKDIQKFQKKTPTPLLLWFGVGVGTGLILYMNAWEITFS